MIQFEKLISLRRASSKLISTDEIVASLFDSLPELKNFKFCKTQEYDDNNYFDNSRVTEINGHSFGYDGYEEEDDVPSDLPKIEESYAVECVVDFIAENYDYSERDVEFNREDFEGFEKEEDTETKYLASYISGSTLPKSFFTKNDSKWAVYYALDHGRFDEKTEFKLFAKEGEMHMALEYAKHVIKGRLPEAIENFFILKSQNDDLDNKCLKEYLEFVKNGEETQDNVAVLPEVRQG